MFLLWLGLSSTLVAVYKVNASRTDDRHILYHATEQRHRVGSSFNTQLLTQSMAGYHIQDNRVIRSDEQGSSDVIIDIPHTLSTEIYCVKIPNKSCEGCTVFFRFLMKKIFRRVE
jgi:hypothetical protein